MESNGKVIAVTGSKGKLAPFVIGALGTAGFRVATDENVFPYVPDLSALDDAFFLVDRWREKFGRIDGLVALTGYYSEHRLEEADNFSYIMRENVMPVVRVASQLLNEVTSVIAIDSSEGIEPHTSGYRAGKAALDAYLHSLSYERPLIDVSYIRPAGPIDTDEKRSGLANLIVSLVIHESHVHKD